MICSDFRLVGGFTKWESSPSRGENKEYLKPPASRDFLGFFKEVSISCFLQLLLRKCCIQCLFLTKRCIQVGILIAFGEGLS